MKDQSATENNSRNLEFSDRHTRTAIALSKAAERMFGSKGERLSEQGHRLFRIARSFVYPESVEEKPTTKNRLYDLVSLLPHSNGNPAYNFAHPEDDFITAPNMHRVRESYLSAIHPSEDKALDVLVGDLDGIKTLQDYWSEQSENHHRDQHSIKPPSLQPGPMIDAIDLKNTIIKNEISKESVLARALQLVDELRIYRDKMAEKEVIDDPAKALSLVDEALSMYIPLCEAISYDLLASVLFDKATQVKYYLAGYHDIIEKARKAYSEYGKAEDIREDMQKIVSKCLGTDLGKGIEISHSDVDNYVWLVHDVDIASASGKDYYPAHGNSQNTTMKLRGRFKSFGAYLEKQIPLLTTSANYNLMDVYAFTLIPKDDEGVALAFRELLEHLNRLKDSEEITYRAAPSRDHALHVKGTEEFRKMVTNQETPSLSGGHPLKDHLIDVPEKDTSYKVTKATFMLHKKNPDQTTILLPVEIQIVSDEVRKEARLGRASHWIFKIEKYHGVEMSDEEKDIYVEAINKIRDQLLQ